MTRPLVRVPSWRARRGLAAGMTTRIGYPDATEATRSQTRERLAHLLGRPPVAWVHQVHGGQVRPVERPGEHGDGDALVTDRPDLVLLVSVADCCPVLLHEPDRPYHAVAHAGWRGTVANVIENTVDALAALGARPDRLEAWIGPAIGPCCFEVGPEVAAQFPRTRRDDAGDRPHVDLKAEVAARLGNAGLDATRIETCPDCTSCQADLYWSYRRDGGICGRHLGFVGRPDA